MRVLPLTLASMAAAVGFAGAASATTYAGEANVAGNTVNYSITTDGVLGQVNPSNIKSFAFDVTGKNSFSFGGDGSDTVVIGAAMTATPFQLVYEYNLPRVFEFDGTSPFRFFAFGTESDQQGPGNSLYIGIGAPSFAPDSGVQVVATAVSAVPEPSTCLLLMGGIAVVGGMARIEKARRRQQFFADVATA